MNLFRKNRGVELSLYSQRGQSFHCANLRDARTKKDESVRLRGYFLLVPAQMVQYETAAEAKAFIFRQKQKAPTSITSGRLSTLSALLNLHKGERGETATWSGQLAELGTKGGK